ncbi:putative pectinesterase [Helianthus annuus]|nr:putative pectinesterase [Helianthus annuus]
MQAVALRIAGNKAVLYHVRILGTQDTLLDETGSHYGLQAIRQCFIAYEYLSMQPTEQGDISADVIKKAFSATEENFLQFLTSGTREYFSVRKFPMEEMLESLQSVCPEIITFRTRRSGYCYILQGSLENQWHNSGCEGKPQHIWEESEFDDIIKSYWFGTCFFKVFIDPTS